ncbi:DUF2063 domain-containing protein [Jeongeupia sp. HS-3]|uniref:HvfC/BufC N-terminal domain-containing protein n=1 Tax=Jeongeupia sp. HS-3 TaxID=1009682 RepID=UPI0018A44489|nr:DNA-binding domain-containing protein [Jeongeupia sp. HS-3]BCL76361.1 DUF2063 domain-containing protein [Jeongeupia sp. HS-3]
MLSYADILADFAAALVDDDHEPACLSVATRAHIGVYRSNTRLNRINALENAFPTVAALVGSVWFRAMAHAYVLAVPAPSANLHDDGETLGDFLAGFVPAAGLPYLADVARLDWTRHCGWHAIDAESVAPDRLAQLDPGAFAAARLRFHPAVSLCISRDWPIADIAAMHEGGAVADLATGGQAVLVWRDGWHALSPDEAGWLAALMAGETLGTALGLAATDPEPLLALLFARALVCTLEEVPV